MAQIEAEMLRELEAAIASLPLRPRSMERQRDERTSLSKRARPTSPEKRAAIEAGAKLYRPLGDLIRKLGDARHKPAIPLLARLWRERIHRPLRIDVGHALFAMKSDEARSALEAMIEDADHLSRFLGIRAVFERDPDRAYDYFERRFHDTNSVSVGVAKAALHIFVPTTVSFVDGKRIPRWTEARAPSWLKQDPRWLDLCAGLRNHDVFGRSARAVLRHADPDDTAAALHRARRGEPPRRVQRRTTRVGSLLDGYKSGAFEAVWREIRSLGDIDGDLRAEVLDVAEETMRRVARNADVITERLRALGWRALMGKLRTLPSADDAKQFDRIESITGGPLPPSLRAFWTIAGGIDWVWDYKCGQPPPELGVDLPIDEMDPLCVDPAGVVGYLLEEWEEQRKQPDPDLVDPFRLSLAPDYLHKANISGGAPYTIELPFFGADPLFAYERHELPFVDYLRLSFSWAGFPGLDEHGDREDVQRFVSTFGQGLEPF
jgi:hypothetical protein